MILSNEVILVTGGTGSMGKTFVQRALANEFGSPNKVIVFSRDEFKQHEMRRAIPDPRLEFILGDIRDYNDVASALMSVDIVINAAALKQVPSCEYFPWQAVQTNCLGTQNIVRAIEALSLPITTVLTVSTDKACKPTTVMGMTKALQERIIVAAAASSNNGVTRYIGVRYGNVMVSRGSVIPLFHEQIAAGGPVTITVPGMTRFLLTIDQAVDTMMAALVGANNGEIYVPNAPSATIASIARALIGAKNIETKIVGIRPAEKLHEIMVSEEEHTERRGDYFAILPMLPELQSPRGPSALTSEFSSADFVLGDQETRKLLEQHGLLT